MNNKNLCAFYGSLRKPMHNYTRFINIFSPKNFLYIRTTTTLGWEMYEVNPFYPGIRPAGNDKSIVIDLFDLSDKAYENVHRMETSADFYEDSIFIDNGNTANIFPYSGDISGLNIITHGDYIRYTNLKKTQDNVY